MQRQTDIPVFLGIWFLEFGIWGFQRNARFYAVRSIVQTIKIQPPQNPSPVKNPVYAKYKHGGCFRISFGRGEKKRIVFYTRMA